VLRVKGSKEAPPNVRGVEALEDFPYVKPPSPRRNPRPPRARYCWWASDAVYYDNSAGSVVGTMPSAASGETSYLQRSIDFRVGKRFVSAIAPP